jgi:hypothetical protein
MKKTHMYSIIFCAMLWACVGADESNVDVTEDSNELAANLYPQTILCGEIQNAATPQFFTVTRRSERTVQKNGVNISRLQFRMNGEDGASTNRLNELRGRVTCISGRFGTGVVSVVSAAKILPVPAANSSYEKCGQVVVSNNQPRLFFTKDSSHLLEAADSAAANKLLVRSGTLACIKSAWGSSDVAIVVSAASIR